MKVFIDYQKQSSGAGKFFSRLAPALRDLDVECVFEPCKCDIQLASAKIRTKCKAKRIVLRVDGVHVLDGEKQRYRNQQIKQSIKRADWVIYQSNFSKRMALEILRVADKRNSVIYNGANQCHYYKAPDVPLNKVVVISARLATDQRRHKRFKDMINISHQYTKTNPDVVFWVFGEDDNDVVDTDNIVYYGHQPENVLEMGLTMADVMLNLAWYDWCPNAVVEALVAGTPVICSNDNGVSEIVGDCGEILHLNEPPTPKLLRHKNPPPFDYQLVFDALDRALAQRRIVSPKYLWIKTIAEQYLKTFNRVLNG